MICSSFTLSIIIMMVMMMMSYHIAVNVVHFITSCVIVYSNSNETVNIVCKTKMIIHQVPQHTHPPTPYKDISGGGGASVSVHCYLYEWPHCYVIKCILFSLLTFCATVGVE